MERRFHKPQGVSASLTSDTMELRNSHKYEEHELVNLSVQLTDVLSRTMGSSLISVGIGGDMNTPEFIVYVRKGKPLGLVPDDYMGIYIKVIRMSNATP